MSVLARIRRRAARYHVAIWSLVWALATFDMAWAQTAQLDCQSNGILKDSRVANRGYTGADGKVHFTYFVPYAAPEEIKKAITDAIKQWNDGSNVSGVFFEPAEGGRRDDPDIRFPQASSSCGTYNDGAISWGSENVQIAKDSAVKGAFVFAHEIAHFLGIDEPITPTPTQATVMNNLIVVNDEPCSQAIKNHPPATLTVQPSDLTLAASCVARARQVQESEPGYSQSVPGEEWVGGSCYAEYLATDYYYCSDTCHYAWTDYQYLRTVCY